MVRRVCSTFINLYIPENSDVDIDVEDWSLKTKEVLSEYEKRNKLQNFSFIIFKLEYFMWKWLTSEGKETINLI